MKLDARDVGARLKALLAGFTVGQKVVTALAVLGLVIGGVLLSHWEGQTTYAPLFSNLGATDAQAVISALQTQKEPYQIAENGTAVLVPQNDVYRLRISLSAAGLPNNDQSGYSLLDKQGMTTSDFQQHVDYQRALEGELSKTIDAIDGVQSSVVHLVIPTQDVFATDASKASASVLVRTLNGQTLPSGEVQAVVHLVSSSVSGLSTDDITVADASGHVLSAPGIASSAAGTARSEQTAAYDAAEAAQLQAMVDQVVGPGHSVVRVAAELDLDQKKTNSQTYVAAPGVGPISSSTTKETYKGTGSPTTAASGVLGPDNNAVPGTATTTTTSATANSYAKTTAQSQNALGTVTTQDESVPGGVSHLSVAVLLDSSGKAATPANIAKIRQVIGAAAGVSTARGDTVDVTALPFQASATAAAAAPATAKSAGIGGLLKTGGLALGLLAILIAAVQGARRTTRTPVLLPPVWDEDRAPLGLPAAERRRALEGGARAAVPAPREATLALPEPKALATVDDQLSELVARQPDDLAQLLRGWLAERRS